MAQDPEGMIREGRLLADLDAVREEIDAATRRVAERIAAAGGFGVPDRGGRR